MVLYCLSKIIVSVEFMLKHIILLR